ARLLELSLVGGSLPAAALHRRVGEDARSGRADGPLAAAGVLAAVPARDVGALVSALDLSGLVPRASVRIVEFDARRLAGRGSEGTARRRALRIARGSRFLCRSAQAAAHLVDLGHGSGRGAARFRLADRA